MPLTRPPVRILAAIAILKHFGQDFSSLVVSLGVGSLAVGLAAQDTLANMFAGITLGGLGSAYGALVGGVVIGLLVETSTLVGVPTELKTAPALVLLILILLVRPQGILGRSQRVG